MTFGPTLPAVMTRDRGGRPYQAHVFCEWCETIHSHGACATHAADHCHRDDSPYRHSGYDLAVSGEAADPEEIRPARFIVDRGHTLVRHLENVEATLCNAVLRPILGPRRERRFERARIIMWASRQWSIDPDAFLMAAEYRKPVLSMRPTIWGIGAASLLTELYGLSLGVVAVRLLEAVSGLRLDKRAKLAIAAEVEASQARQARQARGGK